MFRNALNNATRLDWLNSVEKRDEFSPVLSFFSPFNRDSPAFCLAGPAHVYWHQGLRG